MVGDKTLAFAQSTIGSLMAAAGNQPIAGRVSSRTSLRIHPFSPSTNNAASSSTSPARPIYRVLCKGMVTTDEVVGGPGDEDSGAGGVPVLAVAVCRPQGEVVLSGHKSVLGSIVSEHGDDDDGGKVLLEAMALVEGLHTAIRLGMARIEAITDHRLLHNYMLGLSRPTGEKLVDMISQAQSMRKQFKRCEISLVKQGQVEAVVKLPKEGLDVEIARYLATKDQRESCKICYDDVDTTKLHVVERCSHRFCIPCMKRHMEVMLLHGMTPRCPQLGCINKLTVEEGSKVLLPSRLMEMMAQRVKEEQIHPSQRIYCPYPKCSVLMSLRELVQAGSSSCSDYTSRNNAETLRKCVKCGGPMCVNCKVAWHEGMSCLDYQTFFPHGAPEDEGLHNLARRRLWKQCERCNHMIEHATGCAYITCVCGNHLCYGCGETLTEDHGSCACIRRRRRRGCFPLLPCWGGMCR